MGQSMSPGSNNQNDASPERASPRAHAELDVDVEVAGEKRRVKLVSRDIGAGGMFLHTDQPAPLWKRVKLSIALPDGKNFEIGGEVVRCIPRDRANAKQSAGMAVAFDEVSRTRHKMLLQVVLDLCARRPAAPAPDAPSAPPLAAKPLDSPPAEKRTADENDPDALLSEIDDLLDSMESEIKAKKQPPPAPPPTKTRAFTPPAPAQPAAPVPPPSPPAPPKATAPAAAKPAQLPPRPGEGADLVVALKKDLAAYSKALEDDNYYTILELPKTASAEDIQAAYQRLLNRFKPACPPEALPRELMRQLSEALGRIRKAYAILSHPDRRRAYDFLLE